MERLGRFDTRGHVKQKIKSDGIHRGSPPDLPGRRMSKMRTGLTAEVGPTLITGDALGSDSVVRASIDPRRALDGGGALGAAWL